MYSLYFYIVPTSELSKHENVYLTTYRRVACHFFLLGRIGNPGGLQVARLVQQRLWNMNVMHSSAQGTAYQKATGLSTGHKFRLCSHPHRCRRESIIAVTSPPFTVRRFLTTTEQPTIIIL
jgi:hypothetical protein